MRLNRHRDISVELRAEEPPTFVLFYDDDRVALMHLPGEADPQRRTSLQAAEDFVIEVEAARRPVIPPEPVTRMDVARAQLGDDPFRERIQAYVDWHGWDGAVRDSGGTDIARKCG